MTLYALELNPKSNVQGMIQKMKIILDHPSTCPQVQTNGQLLNQNSQILRALHKNGRRGHLFANQDKLAQSTLIEPKNGTIVYPASIDHN